MIDTSDSMNEELIVSVKVGIETAIETLRKDKLSLDTIHISFISYNYQANQIIPLTKLDSVQMPDLETNGTARLKSVIPLLLNRINLEVDKGDFYRKADWLPWVIIISSETFIDDATNYRDLLENASLGGLVIYTVGQCQNDIYFNNSLLRIESLNNFNNTLLSYIKWVEPWWESTPSRITDTDVFDFLPPPPNDVFIEI